MKLFPLAVLAFSLTACTPKSHQSQTDQTASQPAPQYRKNVSVLISSNQAGAAQAPNFFWYDEKGKQISFAELTQGKPALINFWATWCGPCIKETPDLVALHRELEKKGAVFIGISADRGDDAFSLVTEFTEEHQVPYPIIIDNGDLEEAFGGLRGYPTTFYVDKNGTIVKKLIGLQSKEKFAKEFEPLL